MDNLEAVHLESPQRTAAIHLSSAIVPAHLARNSMPGRSQALQPCDRVSFQQHLGLQSGLHLGFYIHGMAAMASITKPGASAIPVVNGSLLPPRTQVGNCWVSSRRGQLSLEITSTRSVRFVVRASEEGSSGSVVGQTPTTPIETGNSATEVTNSETTSTPKTRKPSPLQKGGTLTGDEAAGKDPAAATLGAKATTVDAGKFDDPRWRAGTWDITKFTSNGKINWDAVIDAEVARRKWLEDNPEASNNSEPVVFDTTTVPWWAWVKRFHLPEAELLNGRAAMVGFVVGYLVDSATGAGLVDQQSTFLGKTLLVLTVLGVLLIRKTSDVGNLKTMAKESTFYDKQWQATWKDEEADIAKEKDSDIP